VSIVPRWMPFGRSADDRSGTSGAEAADAEQPSAGATLQVAEFFTAAGFFLAGVALGDRRLTDLLNEQETLRVARIDASLDASRWPPLVAGPEQEWLELEVADLLLVMPPWQLTDSHRRLHRPAQPISLAIGPYLVDGYVHVPPGAQADGYLARTSPRFVPVTNAVVRREDAVGSERTVAVVLAGFRHVRRLRPAGAGDQRITAGELEE
jgi:hypothetical protein